MTKTRVQERLRRLLAEAAPVRCGLDDRFVILSDLHIGNGTRTDEFRPNASLVRSVLRSYYLRKGYQLVLNGDIEELHKFSVREVRERWKDIYEIFDLFADRTGFHKIVGNHDCWLMLNGQRQSLLQALKLHHRNGEILVFHGHQAMRLSDHVNPAHRFLLRRIAAPLGINNYSVAYDKRKKYQVEKRIYEFARERRILAVIGHTHRPLFESLSRIDSLKFAIEQLCRSYPSVSDETRRASVERKIRAYQQELDYTIKLDRKNGSRSSLYYPGPLVPCVFNSGCAIGKRGVTAIEIADGNIRLVHWFDREKSTKFFDFNGYIPEQLDATDYFRVPLKEDSLDYVFTRVKLLA